LTYESTVEKDPAWSPDGQWLAYAADSSKIGLPGNYMGVTEIYLLNTSCLEQPNTCVIHQLTDQGPYGDTSAPTWSPDSQRLAVECGQTEQPGTVDERYQTDICVTDLNGAPLRNLTNTPDENEYAPGWSPDGRYIAYTHTSVTSLDEHVLDDDVMVIPGNGGQAINITQDVEHDDKFAFWLVKK
jgi:Tol biopolymer transport system component